MTTLNPEAIRSATASIRSHLDTLFGEGNVVNSFLEAVEVSPDGALLVVMSFRLMEKDEFEKGKRVLGLETHWKRFSVAGGAVQWMRDAAECGSVRPPGEEAEMPTEPTKTRDASDLRSIAILLCFGAVLIPLGCGLAFGLGYALLSEGVLALVIADQWMRAIAHRRACETVRGDAKNAE